MTVDPTRATAARDEVLLRVISRHGTPTHHTMRDGQRCTCWTEAKRVLGDLRHAGYVIVKEFDRGR